MKRRKFMALVGGAVVTWPLELLAQKSQMPVIGFLRSSTLANSRQLVDAFRLGLKEVGYVEGQNVVVEYRAAENDHERLKALAANFAHRPVDVIVGNTPAAFAAKAATTKVPIVFAAGADAVTMGLVTSLNRPGGNVTGVSFFATELGGKRLDLLRQLVPSATTIGVLMNASVSMSVAELKDVEAAAQASGQKLIFEDVRADNDLEPAFANFARSGAGALLVLGNAFMFPKRERLVALAARHRLPASYDQRDYPVAGGLMSYGTSITEAYRRAGIYVGRILNGANPAEMPVVRATKFEFVLNTKTAQALGLTIPPAILIRADEVVE